MFRGVKQIVKKPIVLIVIGVTVFSVVAVNLVSLLTKKTRAAETTISTISSDGNVFEAGADDSLTSYLPVAESMGSYPRYVKVGDYVYGTGDSQWYQREFYRFNLLTQAYETLKRLPFPGQVDSSSDIIYDGSDNIYIQGFSSYTTKFYKYTISTDTWTALTDST